MRHHVEGAIDFFKSAWYAGVPTGAHYKFSSATKCHTNLVGMMPQRHQALYKFISATKRIINMAVMMPQHHKALYKNSLEDHHLGVIQCARSHYPFQDPLQYQITVDVELPGVIW